MAKPAFRPSVVFDQKKVMYLARSGATDEEIAAVYDCNVRSVCNRCKKSLLQGRHLMEMDLRQAQLKLALDGNSAMLTFLGKEILNQSGKPSEDASFDASHDNTDDLTTKQLEKLAKRKGK